MSRRPSDDLKVPWKLHISATVAGTVEFMLLDPLTSRSKYGSRSKLVEHLLSEWIEKQRVENPTQERVQP